MKNWMTEAEVAADFDVTVITLRRWVKAGDFPEPVKIGHKVRRYFVGTIQGYLHSTNKTNIRTLLRR